jgi:hypothetical protein
MRVRVSSEKTKKTKGGRRPVGHRTHTTNKRMEMTSRRRRRMEAPVEQDQDPEETVGPHVDGWTDMERQP